MVIPRRWQAWPFQAQNRFLIRLKRPHQPPAGDGITVVVEKIRIRGKPLAFWRMQVSEKYKGFLFILK